MWYQKKVEGVIRRDLRDIEIDKSKWYDEATTSRAGWKAAYRLGLEISDNRTATEHLLVAACEVVREVYSRKFRRENDKKRHKCTSEREKPVCEQHGATQCSLQQMVQEKCKTSSPHKQAKKWNSGIGVCALFPLMGEM